MPRNLSQKMSVKITKEEGSLGFKDRARHLTCHVLRVLAGSHSALPVCVRALILTGPPGARLPVKETAEFGSLDAG